MKNEWPTLRQWDLGFRWRKYTLRDDGLHVIRGSLFGRNESVFRYENIGFDEAKESVRSLWPLIPCTLFILFAIFATISKLNGGNVADSAIPIHLSVAFVFFVVFQAMCTRYLYLSNYDESVHVDFLRSQFGKKKLRAFIDKLHVYQVDYFLDNRFDLNYYDSIEEYLSNIKRRFPKTVYLDLVEEKAKTRAAIHFSSKEKRSIGFSLPDREIDEFGTDDKIDVDDSPTG